MGLEIASEKQSFLNNRLCFEVAARNQSQSLQVKLHTNHPSVLGLFTGAVQGSPDSNPKPVV